MQEKLDSGEPCPKTSCLRAVLWATVPGKTSSIERTSFPALGTGSWLTGTGVTRNTQTE